MARGQALRLGPFVGGMNTASDATTVADSELVDCVNFELDIDGSLTGRPPIVETTAPGGTGNFLAIGRAIIAGVSYVIFARSSGGVYAYDGSSLTTIKSNLKSKVALQYQDNVYIVPAPGTSGTQAGGRWDGSTFTADASMPEGEAAVFHKSRMFIVPGAGATTNTSRLYRTDIISSTTLSWGSFTEVSPGDGEALVDVIVYNDNLMLFKQDSTYVLAYDLQPTDAIVRAISSTIGATAYNCVALYENSVFVYHEGSVFEIVNYDFARTNLKVPFEYDGAVPTSRTRTQNVFLSIVGDRLVLRYYNRIYVYGLKTRTWTRWESASDTLHNFGPFVEFPANPVQSVNTKYYAGSCLDAPHIMYVPNGFDATTQEAYTVTTEADTPVAITCTMRTKNYDLADSHHYKKMMWWGADVYTSEPVVGKASPIISSFRVTWANLSTYTYAELADKTWLQPLSAPTLTETDVTDNGAIYRKFIKFQKAMRFRQMYFQVEMSHDGTTVTGPCRLFTLTAIMASKQTVVSQVS